MRDCALSAAKISASRTTNREEDAERAQISQEGSIPRSLRASLSLSCMCFGVEEVSLCDFLPFSVSLIRYSCERNPEKTAPKIAASVSSRRLSKRLGELTYTASGA